MTNHLAQVLHERAETATVAFDPEDVLVGARRRLARRRLNAGAASVVVAGAAVLGIAVGVPGLTRTEEPPAARQSMRSGSFATGSTVRRDGADLQLGTTVTAYVRVPAGTVLTTGDGLVKLLPVKSLDTRTIGRTSAVGPHLVADAPHDQVAWVDDSFGSPTFVVHDVASDSDRVAFAETSRREADPAWIYAVDGDALFARDARGVLRVDLADQDVEVLSLTAHRATIGAASGGVLAWRSPVPSQGYVVGERFGEGVPMGRHSRPLLSPGGTYLSTDDHARVHVQRTSDGAAVTPTLPATYTRAIAYAWGDDDHLLVAGVTSRLGGDRVVDLEFLDCSVSSGDCRVTEDGHSFPETLDLPTGETAAELARALRR